MKGGTKGKMKYHITLICPYFGKINLPIHKLWLKGCAANPDFEFLLITDDKDALSLPMPDNVKGIYMSWDQCKEKAKSLFDFELRLDQAYKFCDLRPCFGFLFSEYLQGTDFWGHMDSGDTVLGDLSAFITDEMLDTYDKIHSFGHLTLYRNTPEVNVRYQIAPSCGITYRELFARSETTCFDERDHPWSINTIYKENGFSLLERIPNLVADIFPSKWAFQIVEDRGEKVPRAFDWDHGRLFDVTVYNEILHRREIGYVHFQKRKMISEVPDTSEIFYMIPNRFIPANESLSSAKIMQFSHDRLYLDPLKGRIKRVLNYAKQPDVFFRKLREAFLNHNR